MCFDAVNKNVLLLLVPVAAIPGDEVTCKVTLVSTAAALVIVTGCAAGVQYS
jgi:hypothetical protein